MTGGVATYQRISAGHQHTCIILSNGAAKCWGYEDSGRLGNSLNTTTNKLVPQQVTDLTSGIVSISSGKLNTIHTCALTSTGGARCWGGGGSGRLGNGGTTTSTTPVNVSGLTTGVVDVQVGETNSCALTSTGGVACWGWNDSGRNGNGITTSTNQVTAQSVTGLTSGVSRIAVGYRHSCAVMNTGTVKCWGLGTGGRLGNNAATTSATPVDVSNLTNVVQVSAGEQHSCALTSSGGVWCWGVNTNGQLGNNSTASSNIPVSVSGLTSGVSAISAGNSHSCALTNSGGVKCWGLNTNGQLGNNSTAQSNIPVDVSGLTSGVASVSAGISYTCAVTNSGGGRCWGLNTSGQLGNNSTTQSLVPVNVTVPTEQSTSPNPVLLGFSGTGYVNRFFTLSPTFAYNSGPLTNCTVSPALPSGLTLNTTNCMVSGTPTAVSATTNYSVTATNSAGTSTATMTITIGDGLPTISISPSSVSGNVGSVFTITPTITSNGSTTTCSITAGGALPTGLNLNTSTCVISGTASAVKTATTYTITVTNSAGSRTANVTITVSGYVCTSNGFDGPAGASASINNCYYNCSARGQCGGTTLYYPNTCYAQTWGIVSTDCWEEESCYTDVVGYDTQCTQDCSGVSCSCSGDTTPYVEWYGGMTGSSCNPTSAIWIGNTSSWCYWNGPTSDGCRYMSGEFVPIGARHPSFCYCKRTVTGPRQVCNGSCTQNCVDVPIYGNVCSTYTTCQDSYGWRCN